MISVSCEGEDHPLARAPADASAYAPRTVTPAASMLQAGSIIGSVLAFAVSDYLGRKKTSQLACLLWILGTIVWFTSAHGVGAGDGNLSQLLGGRFLAGLGVGMTPVVAPTYLAEIAPRAIRGLCVCIFSGSVYIGILLGYCKSARCRHISHTITSD